MSTSREQALAEARKLVRTFASAPDARRRAQAVVSVLNHADGWTAGQRREIDAASAWLRSAPSIVELEPRCRALLTRIKG